MLQKLTLLMAFQLTGEAIVKLSGIPLPGPLCGMVLLLGWLRVTGEPSPELSAISTTLTDHFGLLFLPAGSAIVGNGALPARDGMPIIVALVVSTTFAVLASGAIAQGFAARRQSGVVT